MAQPSAPNLLLALSYSGSRARSFPFAVPTISSLRRLEFQSKVTFLAGGNGSGKSSLLEAMAVGTDRVPVSADGYERLPAGVRDLGKSLRYEWLSFGPGVEKGFLRHIGHGFFLRAEDFLTYKRQLVDEIAELRQTAQRFGGTMEGYSLQLAQGTVLGQAADLASRYGEDLDAMSHGESFLRFFRARFTGPGLYLLDEPDTALSPQSVLGLMAAVGEMTRGGAQFIIATHNPVLLAYPRATIYSFDQEPVRQVPWEDLEQVRLVRDFLGSPKVFLRHLELE